MYIGDLAAAVPYSSIYAHDNPYFSAGGGGRGEIDATDIPTTEMTATGTQLSITEGYASSHSGTDTADGIICAPGMLLLTINLLMVLI